MTDTSGAEILSAVYTAFGERIAGSANRYGYAGEWGYQTASSDTPGDAYPSGFTFQHVGARYYDPSIGRFLQRDPIGIRGGTNVYAYVANNPAVWIDPSGLGPWQDLKDALKAAWEAVKTAVFPPDPTEHVAGMAGCMMDGALQRHILKDHPDDPDPKPKTCKACKELTPKSKGGGSSAPPGGKGPPPIG